MPASPPNRPRRPPPRSFRLSRFLPYHLSTTAEIVSGELAARLADATGLDMTEWRVMAVLGSFAPLSTGSLAEYTTLNKVAVSRAVARLVDLGYIAREVDDADNRLLKLGFTPQGRRVFERIARVAAGWSEEVLAPLSDREVATLERLLARIRDRVRELGPQRAGAERLVAAARGVHEPLTRSGHP